MLTPERKRQLTVLGVFLVPVVLVKGTSIFCGVGSPAGASAAVEAVHNIDTKLNVTAQSTSWTDAQQAAAAHVVLLDEQPFKVSPLYYETIDRIDEGPASTVDPSLPTMIVQAILNSSSGATALINNKVYRVGDVFEESEWTIITINNDSHTVMFKNTNTDKTAEASVQIDR